MDQASIKHPTTRIERGIALYREYGDEIRHVAGSEAVWSVPSCKGTGAYLVELAGGVCACPDRPPAGEVCKHVVAATIAAAKTAACSGCGLRRHRRELVELHEDNHDNLTHFHGDQLCHRCADHSGVTR